MTRTEELEILRSIEESFADARDFALEVSIEDIEEIKDHVLTNVQMKVTTL